MPHSPHVSRPQYFKTVTHAPVHDVLEYSLETYHVHLNSLWSMRSLFDVPLEQKLTYAAMRAIVEPDIVREIELRGFYEDRMEQDYFICSNQESSS